jgi:hypothetical protein
MNKLWLILALLCLAGCSAKRSTTTSRAGVYKEGADYPVGPATVTMVDGIITLDLKPNGTYTAKEMTQTWSGQYTIKGDHIWFALPNGTRRYGRFQGKDIVPNWDEWGHGTPQLTSKGKVVVTSKNHRFVRQ